MRITGMAVMAAVAGSLQAGIAPAEIRQVTVCMETPSANTATWNEARTVASSIFAGIGVKIRWHSPSKCPMGAIYIAFSSGTPANAFPGALAYARPYEGTHIVVFLDRVKGMVSPNDVGCLLGYTVSHEVAHILQGKVRHSENGIMKPHWEPSDYFEMTQRHLGFVAEDVGLIHRGLDWRESRLAARASAPGQAAERADVQ
jgi:hypothetical protein